MRVGGRITVEADGIRIVAKGNFTVQTSTPKRTGIANASHVHGHYKEEHTIGYIEGEATDTMDTDTQKIFNMTGATVSLQAANGKTYMITGGYYAGDPQITTEEGTFKFRFEGNCTQV